MSTYNSANVASTLGSYTSTQLRTFADDVLNNGFLSAFNARWTLTSRQQTSISAWDSDDQTYFNAKFYTAAARKDAGGTVDFSGVTITDSGTGTHPNETLNLHIDCQWVGLAYVITSLWWTHSVSN